MLPRQPVLDSLAPRVFLADATFTTHDNTWLVQSQKEGPARGLVFRHGSGGAGRWFELGLVLPDQVKVVVLPGVEVAPVEVQVPPDQLAVDAVLAPQPDQAVAPEPPVP